MGTDDVDKLGMRLSPGQFQRARPDRFHTVCTLSHLQGPAVLFPPRRRSISSKPSLCRRARAPDMACLLLRPLAHAHSHRVRGRNTPADARAP